MTNVIVRKGELKPSEGKHENIYEQFIWRTTGQFIGESQVVIMDTQEPIWWNRPLESNQLCRLNDDGLYSYDLPFLGNRGLFKTGYNLLLNKNSVTLTSHINLAGFTEGQIDKIFNFSYNAIYESLIDLGVPKENLTINSNDMLYKGKKFMGGEKLIHNDVFTEDLFVTLKYLPEKHIFDRLTGKYANVRGITGIEEEVPSVTKEKLIQKMYEKITKFFETLD